jgi:acetoin utilization deacetylase AcuC-like enzyme
MGAIERPNRRSVENGMSEQKAEADGLARIPVFYRAEMLAKVRSFSPSAAKPRAVVEDWKKAEAPIEVKNFEPLLASDLKRVHNADFVDAVLAGLRNNGFGSREPEVARSCLYTTGAMIAAAIEALRNRQVAVAPVSGFHHAGYVSCGGFCTFNGLMATAVLLRRRNLAQRVGILDLDQHYGNGTDDIIEALGIDYVRHFTAGKIDRRARDAALFLKELPALVRGFAECDVLLYQAGADPHINDPLGGWMTTEQLRKRDELVFTTARSIGLPVAWNLAGGYQFDECGGIGPVLEIHRNSMRACAGTYVEASAAGSGAGRTAVEAVGLGDL